MLGVSCDVCYIRIDFDSTSEIEPKVKVPSISASLSIVKIEVCPGKDHQWRNLRTRFVLDELRISLLEPVSL